MRLYEGKRRALRWLLGLLAGLGMAAELSAQAPGRGAQGVPQHWISYGEMVSNQFAQWLSDAQQEGVMELHTWLQDRVLKEGKPPLPPLVARVWISPQGMVERVELPSLGEARVDTRLRLLLSSSPLPEPPPADMRQPLVLQLSLDFPLPAGQ
ncbi:YbaB/EbfC family DNA-binding protein [Herbaspirillum huttiense]|uniref:YbaB/EbfC family DNA-binding protein n=1 Tax=Herbaspirillum huttiense TaxID=863372 RepID=UPI0039B0BD43